VLCPNNCANNSGMAFPRAAVLRVVTLMELALARLLPVNTVKVLADVSHVPNSMSLVVSNVWLEPLTMLADANVLAAVWADVTPFRKLPAPAIA